MSFYSCKINDVLLVTMYVIPVQTESLSKEGGRVTDWPSGSLSPVNGKLPFPHRKRFWNIVNLVSLNIQIKGGLLLF
jgi:hypothetical protein